MFNIKSHLVKISLFIIISSSNGLKSNDIPGFQYGQYDIKLKCYENFLTIYNNEEIIEFNLDTKKIKNTYSLDDIEYWQLMENNQYKYGHRKLFYSNGKVIDMKSNKLIEVTSLIENHTLKSIDDSSYCYIFNKVLYKEHFNNIDKKVLFEFNSDVRDYIYSEGDVYWMNNEYDIILNNDVIFNKFNTSSNKIDFKSVKDYLVCYSDEKVFVYNKVEKTSWEYSLNIEELELTNNYIYMTYERELYSIRLQDFKPSIVNLDTNTVITMSSNNEKLFFMNKYYQLFSYDGFKQHFITELNIGLPIKAKYTENGLVVFNSIGFNRFVISIYNEENRTIFEESFKYRVNQYEKLPFHIDNQKIVYLVEKDEKSSIRLLDLNSMNTIDYSIPIDERIKFISHSNNKLWAVSYDSTFLGLNLSTTEIDYNFKLNANLEYLEYKDENGFYYLSSLGSAEFEFGSYNLLENKFEKVINDNLVIWDENLDYPIDINSDLSTILVSTGLSTEDYYFNLEYLDVGMSVSNREYKFPTPQMPFKLNEKDYLIFYRNGIIIKYDNSIDSKIFINESNNLLLDDSLYVDYSSTRQLTISDINNNTMMYNDLGSIIIRDFTITSIESQNKIKDNNSAHLLQNDLILNLDEDYYNSTINIYDLDGKKRQSATFDLHKGENHIELNLELNNGLYFIQIANNKQNQLIKLLKND